MGLEPGGVSQLWKQFILGGHLKAKSKNSDRFKEGEKEHSSLKCHMIAVV